MPSHVTTDADGPSTDDLEPELWHFASMDGRRSVAIGEPIAAPKPSAVQAMSRRRILVVDDNRDLAESLAMILRLWGHDVAVAYDGAEAMAAAMARPPEVVFLDIGLPHIDGFEVAQRMRANPRLRQARIVAITGYGRDEDQRRSREAGIDLHLTKPVDPIVLKPLLDER